MGLKKKIGMGIAAALLGLALVTGGTFAYFSATAVSNNTFAAGTLDVSVEPTAIIDVDNLKPGDWMKRDFVLSNDGTLDISKVLLKTDYEVEGTNEDFGKHIRVDFLKNKDKSGALVPKYVVLSKTLYELKSMSPDVVKELLVNVGFGEEGGLKAGDSDDLSVKFTFVDNGKDQNYLQGASLKLEWTFDAYQTKGEER